jgi:hypothetical protein
MPAEFTPGVASNADGVLKRFASRDHFTAVIVAAMAANVMRALQFAAVIALGMGLPRQRLVAAPHPRTRGRRLTFRNSHGTESFFRRATR